MMDAVLLWAGGFIMAVSVWVPWVAADEPNRTFWKFCLHVAFCMFWPLLLVFFVCVGIGCLAIDIYFWAIRSRR